MAEHEQCADHGGEPDRAEPEPDVRGPRVVVFGELVERVLDRRAQLLERRAVAGTGVEAGVDLLGQLARQVGAAAPQRAGAI